MSFCATRTLSKSNACGIVKTFTSDEYTDAARPSRLRNSHLVFGRKRRRVFHRSGRRMAWHYGTWRHTRGSCAPDSTRAGRRLGSRRGTRHQTASAYARTRIVRLFVTRKSYEAEFFLLNFYFLLPTC